MGNDGLAHESVHEAAPQEHTNERSPLLAKGQPIPRNEVNSNNDEPYKNINAKNFYAMFLCILMSYTLSFFDSTFMASSHPIITSDFNASHVASWLSTTFYLCNTISQPLYGRFSDIFGRRSVYFVALTIFAVGTLWCALAQSIGGLIAARGVAGLGTGGVVSLSEILMANTIKIEHRGVYQSYLNIAYGTGTGLGAALGGILCERLGWRAAFGLQMPFIAVVMITAYVAVPRNLGPCLAHTEGKSVAEALKSFDTLGALALTVAVSGLIMGINLGGNVLPWSHPLITLSLATFALAAIALIWIENRATSPVLPPALLSTVPFGNFMWANIFSIFIMQGVLFNVPLLLQAVRQVSPSMSGLFMFVPLMGTTIASVIVGFVVKRTGGLKPSATVGAVFVLMGLVPLSMLGNQRLPLWSTVLLIPWPHVGNGFLTTISTISLLAVCKPEDQAVVSTTLGLSRMLGNMLGVAISSLAVQNFLLLYLSQMVTGDEPVKKEIIAKVRTSVRAILELDSVHKAEVIGAYALALRNTFLCFLFAGLAICCLIFPLRLPRLKGTQPGKAKLQTEKDNRDAATYQDAEEV